MGGSKRLWGVCLALVLGVFSTASVHAQGAAALGDPMRGTPGLVMDVGRGSDAEHDDSAIDRDDDPMGLAGIGVKMGLGFVPAMNVSSPIAGVPGQRIGARTGLHAALPITFGDGSGLAFDLEPFLFRYGRDVKVEGVKDSILEVGGYAGPAVRFHMQHFYLSLGIGAKVGWMIDDMLDVGMDLFGRVPITATYYVSDAVGFTFELGLAYGATGIKAKNLDSDVVASLGGGVPSDALGAASEAMSVRFGRGFAMDSTIGLRFP